MLFFIFSVTIFCFNVLNILSRNVSLDISQSYPLVWSSCFFYMDNEFPFLRVGAVYVKIYRST